MNNIEETLWNYIDGNCTPDEQSAISKLIAGDEAYRIKYQELLALNKEFAAIELDEPPMAFTYNVIEAIRTEQAQVPLKAAINKRIIMGITIFFVLTLTGFLIYALTSMNWSGQSIPDLAVKVPANFKMPDVSAHISKPVVEGFMFFDVVLALYLFDTFLRRKNVPKQVN
ncbi:hypothetical protein [Mucilaginibacter sp.]|uniref:anti-sigma factor family protein n=1 Tax=Mucilaginibacter sp. TaxID=1882438 RepID=UPI00260B02FB|nr:hypothetical protein [Mucilaginibacter sp.]MDB4918697.1 hypothetical protein [Mucilaginibacter sp.]